LLYQTASAHTHSLRATGRFVPAQLPVLRLVLLASVHHGPAPRARLQGDAATIAHRLRDAAVGAGARRRRRRCRRCQLLRKGLCLGLALPGYLTQPPQRLAVIALPAFPVGNIHDAEAALRVGVVALLGCLVRPVLRRSEVLFHSDVFEAYEAEVELHGGLTLLGRFRPPPRGFGIFLQPVQESVHTVAAAALLFVLPWLGRFAPQPPHLALVFLHAGAVTERPGLIAGSWSERPMTPSRDPPAAACQKNAVLPRRFAAVAPVAALRGTFGIPAGCQTTAAPRRTPREGVCGCRKACTRRPWRAGPGRWRTLFFLARLGATLVSRRRRLLMLAEVLPG